jgi:hypothetical protein
MVTAIFAMGFFGLRQPRIFVRETANHRPDSFVKLVKTVPDEAKYRKSSFSQEQSALLLQRHTSVNE